MSYHNNIWLPKPRVASSSLVYRSQQTLNIKHKKGKAAIVSRLSFLCILPFANAYCLIHPKATDFSKCITENESCGATEICAAALLYSHSSLCKPATMLLNYRLPYFVTLIQSMSRNPDGDFCAGSSARKPNLAPIHLPSRIWNSSPTVWNFFPFLL